LLVRQTGTLTGQHPEQTILNGGFIVNIELSVKEENGVVKIKITSPNQPVVMESTSGKTPGRYFHHRGDWHTILQQNI